MDKCKSIRTEFTNDFMLMCDGGGGGGGARWGCISVTLYKSWPWPNKRLSSGFITQVL